MQEEIKDGIRSWTEPFGHLLSCKDWKKFVVRYLEGSPNIQALTSDIGRYLIKLVWSNLKLITYHGTRVQ